MRELDEKFGDPRYGSGTWYLNPKMYARRLYVVRRPGEKRRAYGEDPELAMAKMVREAIFSTWEDPDHHAQILEACNRELRQTMANQVMPLEEAKRVAELAYPIVGMQCMCRTAFRAEEESNINEYTCTGLGVGMLKWERWPERYKGGVEFMTAGQAKEWLTMWDKKGFMHCIMTMGGIIGGICNCDYPDCVAIRYRLNYGTGNLVKSNWVATVDYDKCNGCGICMQRCHFGALRFEYSPSMNKANIDAFKCFGCGLCHTGCPRGAITLVKRESIPALEEVW